MSAKRGEQKYAEAEPLLVQGYQGMTERAKTIPPQSKDRLTKALERLVHLYDAWNKPEQAKEWRTKLRATRTETKK